jgi:ABC-type uncharacterized transport system substrate-binding protein
LARHSFRVSDFRFWHYRYEELTRNVVERRPSVIFTSGAEFARRLKAATSAIPMVAILTDPLATGLPMTRLH